MCVLGISWSWGEYLQWHGFSNLVFSLMAIFIYVVVTLWSLCVLSELAFFTPQTLDSSLLGWFISDAYGTFGNWQRSTICEIFLLRRDAHRYSKPVGALHPSYIMEIPVQLHQGYIYIYRFQMYHMCTVSTPFFEFYTILYFSNFTSHLFLFFRWFSPEQALHERFDRYFKCIAFTGNDLDGDPVIVERSGQLSRKRLMIS